GGSPKSQIDIVAWIVFELNAVFVTESRLVLRFLTAMRRVVVIAPARRFGMPELGERRHNVSITKLPDGETQVEIVAGDGQRFIHAPCAKVDLASYSRTRRYHCSDRVHDAQPAIDSTKAAWIADVRPVGDAVEP